ncbi:MAG: glycogen synthase GlgA [Vicinamibacterales bacterium]|nr:glycogen synthase GlgA [Vicinamibacterales bacterium]HAK55295.1 glycogen synthase GlgA [Acidobacteriota bacterium]
MWSKGEVEYDDRRMSGEMPPDAAARAADGEARLRVVMVVSEAVPFAKTGGLADVSSAFSLALAGLGHDVSLVLPRYREAADAGSPAGRVTVTVGEVAYEVGLFAASLGRDVRVTLLDCPPLYDREGLYGAGGRDHPDNPARFGLLVRAALGLGAAAPEPPSVIHAHDWQAALGPVMLSAGLPGLERLRGSASVQTIHNLAYQGVFPPDCLGALGLAEAAGVASTLAHKTGVSFLKGGIVYSDAVTTVSPGYAREIVGAEFGRGLDPSLRERGTSLTGILNGIDVDVWDPTADPHLPAPFSAGDLEGKRASKRAVIECYGLPTDEATLTRPLVGMVSRMVPQKGLDLLAEISDDLAGLDATFVVLGTGMAEYQALWQGLAARHPAQVGVHVGFDEARAHLVEGGADLFLMPSRFEPCGLNQLYSLRYGTVPVVRATGGLADTVRPFDPATGQGTGFVFTEYSAAALMASLRAALAVFGDRAAWRRIQVNGMAEDHSWDVSAREYVKVYRRAVASARRRAGGTAEQAGPGSTRFE